MNKETVNLKSHSYPIFIGTDSSLSNEAVSDFIVGNDVAIITNDIVGPLYLEELTNTIKDKNIIHHILNDGEQEKKLKTIHKIIDQLLEEGFGRDATLVSLGGGVVGDITGFAASIFMRGVNFIQIPTTLLAQVDASVGGKTGVNHALGKNLIGSFYQPECVVCDPRFLKTLGDKQVSEGLAEIIKYGLIYDADFFGFLEQNVSKIIALDKGITGHAIQRSCQIKAEIVSQDEKENSIRAILNFGHTFGHAIETLMGYDHYSHGDGVSIGMVLAARLSESMGMISNDDTKRIIKLLEAGGLPVSLPSLNGDEIINVMLKDKKVKNRQIQLVLLKSMGEAYLTSDYPEKEFKRLLAGA